MPKHPRIFVAGATGLVGSSITKKLIEKGYQNITGSYLTKDPTTLYGSLNLKKLDLKRQSDTEAFIEKEKPDHIYLAAAKVGGILANNTYKAEFIYNNLIIAANVVEAAYKYGVKKLLNLGSSCIYPKFAPQPMKEEYLLTGILEPTNEPYAMAKISAIKLCRYYNEQYGTNYLSVMPTNIYGPGDNFNLETAHVLPALIRKFHLAKLLALGDDDGILKDVKTYKLGFGLDEKIDIGNVASIKKALEQIGITKDHVLLWGSGEPYREFLYVDDLADACVFLMENYNYKDIGEFVNIGTGKDIKLKDLAYLIKNIVGFQGGIRHDTSKPDGTPKKLLDVSKMTALGWQAKTSLEEGIRKEYEWYINNKVQR